jgi:hypothetical protein
MLPGLGAARAMAVVDRQGPALQERFAGRRDNVADAARLRAEAPRIADVEALLKDRRTLRLVLEAFQLESEIDKRALLRRVLTEDPAAPASLVNRLTDQRWRALASAFATVRPAAPDAQRRPLDDRVLLDRIVQGAMVNRFEKSMGETNPGLREALYFRRMAGTATSVNALMADRALLEVTRGALGLPPQFGLLSFERQRDLIERRLDVKALQDPAQVARMAARYLAQLQPAAASTPATALFEGGGAAARLALIGRRVSFNA